MAKCAFKIILLVLILTAIAVPALMGYDGEGPLVKVLDNFNDSDTSHNSLGFNNWYGYWGTAGEFNTDEVFLHNYDTGQGIAANSARRFTYGCSDPGFGGWYTCITWNDVSPMDISAYSHLSFRIKCDSGNEICRVKIKYGSPGSATSETQLLAISDYCTPDHRWQAANIPLDDFTGLDKSSVREIILLFSSTGNPLADTGTLYVDNLCFSEGYGKPASAGPVKINRPAKQLIVNGAPFYIKGVGYHPVPIGSGYPVDDPAIYDRDFPLLLAMGCNTIRLWNVPGMNALSKAEEYGIKVLAGFWMDYDVDFSLPAVRDSIKQQFTLFVNTYKNSPSLLVWAIGNENNYVNGSNYHYYTLCNELAEIAYQIEGASYHPVIIVNGHLYNIGVDEYRADDLQLNYIDAWGCNMYTQEFGDMYWGGEEHRNIFEVFEEKSSKPLIITEYGADAFRTMNHQTLEGYTDEDMQADWVANNIRDIAAGAGACVGSTIMAYSDEWWKDPAGNFSVQDRGGWAGIGWHAYPDDYANEEYWGLMEIAPDGTWSPQDGLDDIKPRRAYDKLKSIFASIPGGCQIGAVLGDSAKNAAFPENGEQGIINYETGIIQRKLACVKMYSKIVFDFPFGDCLAVYNHGTAGSPTFPYIDIHPSLDLGPGIPDPTPHLRQIIEGEFDTYIQNWARQAKAFGKPLWICFDGEMNGGGHNGSGEANGGGTKDGYGDINEPDGPEIYKDAWRHIHDIFEAAGADNVAWVWAVGTEDWPREDWNKFENYYPGDEYVDWIGVDGYNWGRPEYGGWKTFRDVFETALYRLRAINAAKPIILAEFGCAHKTGDKSAWITDCFNLLKTTYPYNTVRCFIWFDLNKEENWLIDSDGNQAAQAALTDPYFTSDGNTGTCFITSPPAAKPPAIGAVKVSGRQILVNGQPFTIKGVGYQPIPVGYWVNDYNFYGDAAIYSRDFALLRGMNCNTIRTWGKVLSTVFLDAAYNGNVNPIYVIMGFHVDNSLNFSDPVIRQGIIDEFKFYVQSYRNHPAVLMWAVGNENNYGYLGDKKDWYTLVNELAWAAYEVEGASYHPVTTPNGDIWNATGPIGNPDFKTDDASMTCLDVWGANIYSGWDFQGRIQHYATLTTKPFWISEYGFPGTDERNQAEGARVLWEEMARNFDTCSGGTIMEYSDEWWKSGYPDRHNDSDGVEFFGVVSAEDNGAAADIMRPKPAYYALKEAWAQTPLGNIAFGKNVYVSSVEEGTANVAAYAVDGNFATRWSSASSDPQYIYVDLGEEHPIGSMVLWWEAAYGSAYEIQLSDDAESWQTVYSVSSEDGFNDFIYFDNVPVKGQYVRLHGTQRGNTSWGYSLWELEIYEPTPHNTAKGKDVSASSVEGEPDNPAYTPDYAVDGDFETRWSSDFSNPQSIDVDLGAKYDISRIALRWEAAYGRAYKIEKSEDGVNWSSVYETTTGDGSDDYIDFDPPFIAQYIRLYGTQRATPYGYSLWEFQVMAVPTEYAGSVKVPDAYSGIYTIQDAVDAAGNNYRVDVAADTYTEDLTIPSDKEGLVIEGKGSEPSLTEIQGNIIAAGADAMVKNMSILYKEKGKFTYTNGSYGSLDILPDAGITAIDSNVIVENCVISPDPAVFSGNFGKGIQIWNLYGTAGISPIIDNCRISNADIAIYLYSQAFGGAILGEIRNNALDNNDYGIVMRMHKEKPVIDGNTFENSAIDAIHITYEDGPLLAERLDNISNNHFISNIRNVYCDELGAVVIPTGPGNIYE